MLQPKHPSRRGRRVMRLIQVLNFLTPKRAGACTLDGTPDDDDGIAAVAAAVAGGDRASSVTVLTKGHAAGSWPKGVRLVRKHSPRGLVAYLRSEYVITTHGTFGSHRSPRSQTVVNIWHGAPSIKKIGRFDGEPAAYADIVPVGSGLARALRAAELGVDPDHIVVTGDPRNDVMLRADAADVRNRLGVRAGRHFVWLPTYRESVRGEIRHDGSVMAFGLPYGEADLRHLDAALDEMDAEATVSLHPLGAQDTPRTSFKRLRIVTRENLARARVSIADLLAAADVLITDASSVWIDFLLLDRPVVGAFPDLEEYRKLRGFVVEPYETWFPGPIGEGIEDVIRALKGLEIGDRHRGDRALRRSLLHEHRDDRSAARLLVEMGLN